MILSFWAHSKKEAMCKPEGGPAADTESADTSIMDFSASRAMRNKCMPLELPNLWYFAIEVQAN